ncbi:hypothetical protein ACJVC5_11210 [Peredibacter sp. HCB2-198]|uniref:hypothetical protein n=1 Tax=Peredibacter sp. HCB2-198 TaxID=3383025 RepID=UPI0038B503FF
MKTLTLGTLTLISVSFAHANTSPLLLDAACSYTCTYTVERCYEGCYEMGSSKKKYVDYRGLTLEAIESVKYSDELKKVCLQNLPEMTQWDADAKFSRIEDFKCEYFKH